MRPSLPPEAPTDEPAPPGGPPRAPPPVGPAGAWMRRVLSRVVGPGLVLAALFGLDWALTDGRAAGWERNTVRKALARIEAHPTARVAILGSSTSKDWLPEALLGQVLGVPAATVLDAHLNGCHQDCTWAEVRRLKAEGRRYEAVFFGTNLFQLCEFAHTKRVLQQAWLTPLADVPALLATYRHAEQPLRPAGRLLGLSLSAAFGDGTVIRRKLTAWAQAVWNPQPADGRRRPSWAWARTQGLPGAPPLTCSYTPEAIALKRGYTEGLLDDLAAVTDRVYLVLLPDASLGLDAPEHRARWADHLDLHRRLAAERPHVHLVDLATDGVSRRDRYRDGFHLNPQGVAEQQALFKARLPAVLAASGWVPDRARAAGAPGAVP